VVVSTADDVLISEACKSWYSSTNFILRLTSSVTTLFCCTRACLVATMENSKDNNSALVGFQSNQPSRLFIVNNKQTPNSHPD
jgi:hypothetical protein